MPQRYSEKIKIRHAVEAFYNVAKIIGTGLLVYLAGSLKDEYEGPAEDAVLLCLIHI